jgi:ABC-type polysaccharide/polyol phosphate export permease
MNKVTVFKVSLILTIVLNVLGAYFKIAHYPHGTLLLSVSFIASLVFVISGLIDVFKNDNCKTHEKIMWTVGFIFLSWIAGLLYYPKFKKRNQLKSK